MFLKKKSCLFWTTLALQNNLLLVDVLTNAIRWVTIILIPSSYRLFKSPKINMTPGVMEISFELLKQNYNH